MGENNKAKLAIIAVVVIALIVSVVALTQNWGKNKDEVNMQSSIKKLNELHGKLSVNSLTPKKDPDFSYDDTAEILPDISEYPFSVNPTTADFLTIYASPDADWLVDVATKFNQSGVVVEGKPVSVGIRGIPSGLGADFISSGKYTPDIFAPSSELWGDMLISKGAKVSLMERRIAGNVAGVVLSNKKNDELSKTYGAPNTKTIVDGVLNGELSIGYTNPLSNSEGLNFILDVLNAFDANEPFGDTAVSQLKNFQDKISYVAYEEAQLKNSALGGTLDGFVSDYKKYINSSELTSAYMFIPFGVRHDQPVYQVGELSALKTQVASKFVDYCKTAESQQVATGKGFNGMEEYAYPLAKPTGMAVVQAQETWKKEKNGTSDLTAVFVADVSGSMEGAPILKLKASLNRATTFIESDTNIGLVTFSDSVNVAVPIAKFDMNQRAYFSNAVKTMRASGGTAMFDAVVVAEKMLIDAKEQNPNTKLMLFVLTDGETNEGYGFEDIEKIAKGLKIPIYTIGYNADIDVLQELSNINEATTMNAETDDVIYKLQSLFDAQM